MKFVDDSQNLRGRLHLIQALVMVMLGVLGVRLYLLQIVNGPRYAEIAENQRIRLLPIPAPRGVIFDRNGKLLVDSKPIYSIILSREDTKGIDRYTLIKPLAEGLMLDPEILRERFDQVKSQPAFESILIKEDASPVDIAWVDAHQLEVPALRVEQTPERRYPPNGLLAHVLGYVQEISPEQLDEPRYKEKHYKPGDVIGQNGIEAVHDQSGSRGICCPAERSADAATQSRDSSQIPARFDLENSDGGRGVATGCNYYRQIESGLRRGHSDRKQVHALYGQPWQSRHSHR